MKFGAAKDWVARSDFATGPVTGRATLLLAQTRRSGGVTADRAIVVAPGYNEPPHTESLAKG